MAILKAIQKTFGADLDQHLIDRIDTIDSRTLGTLAANYYHIVKGGFDFPEKPNLSLRPFVHHSYYQLGSAQLDHPDFRTNSVSALTNEVKKYLLYCHGVCLSDPAETVLGLADRDRGALRRYLEFILELKELIESEIVVLLDDWPLGAALYNKRIGEPVDTPRHSFETYKHGITFTWPPSLWAPLDQVARAARDEPFRTLPGETFFGNLHEKIEWGSLNARDSERELELCLNAVDMFLLADEAFKARIDLFFPSKRELNIFNEYIGFMKRVVVPDVGALSTVASIISLDLPGLSKLSVSDIVAVRKSSDSFDRLRTSLGRAAFAISGSSGTAPDGHLLKQELDEVRRAVEKEVSNSGSLISAKGAMRSFTIGSVAALALATYAPPAAAIAKGGLVAGFDLLLGFLSGAVKRDSRMANEALLRHFCIF